MSKSQFQGIGVLPLSEDIIGGIGASSVTNQNVIVGNSGNVSTGESPTLVYTQATPAASWLITHNLSGFPSVSLTDPTGNAILAGYQYLNSAQVLDTFSQPVAGLAYLNI